MRDFTVEVRRARLDRAKFDAVAHQLFLKDISEKLAPAIRLDALDGKRQLLKNEFEKQNGVSGGLP